MHFLAHRNVSTFTVCLSWCFMDTLHSAPHRDPGEESRAQPPRHAPDSQHQRGLCFAPHPQVRPLAPRPLTHASPTMASATRQR